MAEGRTEGWLFPGSGATGHLVDIKKSWAVALKLADVAGATLHDLRRTAATRMLENGASIAAVMEAGNWSSPHVLLKHYARVGTETRRVAAEGIRRRKS